MFEDDIKNCTKALTTSGVILYPTDTIWGLGCDATDQAAIEKIIELKRRPREKGLIVLLAEARDIIQYVAAPPPDIIDMVEQFDRPTTVIYTNALGFPQNLTQDDGSIAIRVTNDPFCKALIKRFRKPIVSTSANFSGQPPAPTYGEIDNEIIAQADYVVKYRQDDTGKRPPSRLIRLNDEGEMEIIRP